jgi:hypothetical protein
MRAGEVEAVAYPAVIAHDDIPPASGRPGMPSQRQAAMSSATPTIDRLRLQPQNRGRGSASERAHERRGATDRRQHRPAVGAAWEGGSRLILRCGIGAAARPNWKEQPSRETLSGVQWRS